MTPDLGMVVEEYRDAAEAQLALLDQLLECAVRQHEASLQRDTAALAAAGAERELVMSRLERTETGQRPRRDVLGAHLAEAQRLAAFASLPALHRQAEARVAQVLALDRDTAAHLEQGDRTRREAAQAIEAGEATLAAYRKVLSPAIPRSGIVDRRW